MPDSSDPKKPIFDLNMHTARLLMREPFFAALSRRIDKTKSHDVPTAGVRINPERLQFEMLYNPDFFEQLVDEHKLGVLMHEFYHIILEHVTTRKPAGGISQQDNVAMDLAINGLPEMKNKLPSADNPGPIMPSGEPMKGCIPGEDIFEDYPPGKSYEWYLAKLKKDAQESEGQEGAEGSDSGQAKGGIGNADSFDSHDQFGQAEGTSNEIAKERLRDAIKQAAQEAEKAHSWGSVSSTMRKQIMDSITTKVDWRKVLRMFVKNSQRADKRSTPKKINKRYPRIHAGRRVRRQCKLAIAIDQSGSVDDGMLALFFAELGKLAEYAEFVIIPFDTRVVEEEVFTWKKGQRRTWERVACGGTDFVAPTKYINERNFDGCIILTDMCAPKPGPSQCQRMWMTTPEHAARPYFQTNERVIAVER